MDHPDSALARMRELAASILADADRGGISQVEGIALAEEVQSLDEWISRGGFRPADWKGEDNAVRRNTRQW